MDQTTLTEQDASTVLQDNIMRRVALMRAWMAKQGINQKQLAAGVGMTEGAISRFLSGQREFTGEFEVAFMHAYGLAATAEALGLVFTE